MYCVRWPLWTDHAVAQGVVFVAHVPLGSVTPTSRFSISY